MITLEEARALKPGDSVWSQAYVMGRVVTIEWKVAPFSGEWPDPRIVQYLESAQHSIPSFVFSDALYKFHTDLCQGE